MSRSLAQWRPARMGVTKVLGIPSTTAYVISAVGSAVTSTLALNTWAQDPSAQDPLLPAMIGFMQWGVLALIVTIVKNDGPLGLGLAASALGGSAVAFIVHLGLS